MTSFRKSAQGLHYAVAGDVESIGCSTAAAAGGRRKADLPLNSLRAVLTNKLLRQGLCAALIMMGLVAGFYCLYLSSIDRRSTLLEVMQCTHDVFVEHGVTYFLDYGSLLGAVRHKGFIPWDGTDDLDVGVLVSETEKIYALGPQIARRCGNHMIHRSDVALLPGLTAFVIKRGAFRIFYNRITPIYIDLADYEPIESPLPRTPATAAEVVNNNEEEDGSEIVVLTDRHYPELHFRFPLDKLLPVRECEFEGRTFHCPHDADFVLTQQYGPDWAHAQEELCLCRPPKRNKRNAKLKKTKDMVG
jgi:hypothetical protein